MTSCVYVVYSYIPIMYKCLKTCTCCTLVNETEGDRLLLAAVGMASLINVEE